MDVQLPESLREAAKSKKIIPFIGAGFSKALDLPLWSELIDDVIAKRVGFAPEIARIYGDFLQLTEYLYNKNNGIGNLRSQLDKSFNSKNINIADSQAHLLLPELNAPAIYTTNWDNQIESAFDYCGKQYNKIVTLNDILDADHQRPSIVKFHGDFSSDESLVLTETQYYERLDFESALDIRLRSDMLNNTLLFLGYSLSDLNVRYMCFKLQKLLTKNDPKNMRRDKGKFAYIAIVEKNPVFENICKQSRDIGVIYLDSIDPQNSLINLLSQLAGLANQN